MKIRIMTVVGARPQFIKTGAISRALAKRDDMTEIMVHTGQYFDQNMSQVFFDELHIPPPAHQLDIFGGDHGEMTGRMLETLEDVMMAEQPHWVMVYGDTNSTLAGALAAAKLNIRVAHVEAGLRSFNRTMPEEINRVIADHLSRLLSCPTHNSLANLKREGITDGVHLVGDIMYDASLFAAEQVQKQSSILEELNLIPGSYAVATVHRAKNTDNREQLRAIMDWLKEQAKERVIIFPVHPRTRKALARDKIESSGLMMIDPIGYLDMARLLEGAEIVYTDSGGLQKEAYFHGKPCVTLRSETEWVELVECGWNRLWSEDHYKPRKIISDYGSGHASEDILTHLATHSSRPGI